MSALVAAVVAEGLARLSGEDCAPIFHVSAPAVGRDDRARVRQLVSALLDNALAFGSGKPVEVAVAQEGDHVLVKFVDHGPGVAQDDAQHIFQRFERAASTESHGGFGLGLWVARLIAETHGGTLALTPTAGGGATFTARFPTGR